MLAERSKRYPIVLFDEGTVLIATLLFVYTCRAPVDRDFDRFLELVPRPDGVVYLSLDAATLTQRGRTRSHPRRELRRPVAR